MLSMQEAIAIDSANFLDRLSHNARQHLNAKNTHISVKTRWLIIDVATVEAYDFAIENLVYLHNLAERVTGTSLKACVLYCNRDESEQASYTLKTRRKAKR